MKTLLTSAAAGVAGLVASAGTALAQSYSSGCSIWRPWNCLGTGGGSGGGSTNPPSTVPEIDASAGLLAIAAVTVVTLFVWERRRRRAA